MANRLIGHRAEHGLTQTCLARLLGMSQPAVFLMELGEPVPTLATLLRLPHALGLEMLVSPTPAERATAEPACDLRQPRVQVRVVTTRGATMTIAIR